MSTIAIIGGTGPQGKGLGYRFARGGARRHALAPGRRSGHRGGGHTGGQGSPAEDRLRGAHSAKAVEPAELVLLAVPFDGHDLVRSWPRN